MPIVFELSKFIAVVLFFVRVEMKSQVRSITRGREDSFVLEASSGCQCDAFNSNRAINACSTDISTCCCRCRSDAPTFYAKQGTEGRCLNNTYVISDAKVVCNYYFESEGVRKLKVVDLRIGQKSEEIKPNYRCNKLEVKSWRYRHNGTWKSGYSNSFPFSAQVRPTRKSQSKKLFLQWDRTLDKQYQGLLIKVNLMCTHGMGEEDDGCIMFKTSGTKTVSGYIPNAKSTKIPAEASTAIDDKEESTVTTSSQRMKVGALVGIITAGAVLLLLVTALVVFMCMRRQKKKVKRAARARSARDNPMSPPHEYEFIQYPVTGPRVAENILYEKGPDDQLTIRSRASSTSSKVFQSVDANALLGSQDFLLANISRPPSRDTYQSLSASFSSEEQGKLLPEREEQVVQPYEKLLTQTEPLQDDGYEEGIQVTEHHDAKPDVPLKNIYQSLKKPKTAAHSERGSEECTTADIHPENKRHDYTLMSGESATPTMSYIDMQRSVHAQGLQNGPSETGEPPHPNGSVKMSWEMYDEDNSEERDKLHHDYVELEEQGNEPGSGEVKKPCLPQQDGSASLSGSDPNSNSDPCHVGFQPSVLCDGAHDYMVLEGP